MFTNIALYKKAYRVVNMTLSTGMTELCVHYYCPLCMFTSNIKRTPRAYSKNSNVLFLTTNTSLSLIALGLCAWTKASKTLTYENYFMNPKVKDYYEKKLNLLFSLDYKPVLLLQHTTRAEKLKLLVDSIKKQSCI